MSVNGNKRSFGQGWFFDSWKHGLAAKGIKTKYKVLARTKFGDYVSNESFSSQSKAQKVADLQIKADKQLSNKGLFKENSFFPDEFRTHNKYKVIPDFKTTKTKKYQSFKNIFGKNPADTPVPDFPDEYGFKAVKTKMAPDEFIHKTRLEAMNNSMRRKDSESYRRYSEMTDDEFAQRIAHQPSIDHAKEGLQSKKPVVPVPWLEYDEKGDQVGHEGRNRAIAAKQLGMETIPVIILHPTEKRKFIQSKKFQLEKAWPYGEGQTRIKLLRGKKFELEPTSIDVVQSNLPKTHKAPVTEKEIKGMLELMTPEELKASVKKVEIKAPSSMLGSTSGTYGQAFTEGRIGLYTKPFRERKTKASTFMIARTELTPEEAKNKYLYDVLPHEVGHEVLGHKSTRKDISNQQAEAEAEKFAEQFRKRIGIPEEPYYSSPNNLNKVWIHDLRKKI